MPIYEKLESPKMTHPIVQLVNAKSLAEGLKELQADNSTEATNTINIIVTIL